MTHRMFEQISHHLEQQLPFVVYRKPGENMVQAFLQRNDVLHKSNGLDSSGFLFAPFKGDPVLIPESESTRIAMEMDKSNVKPRSINESKSTDARADFENLVSAAVAKIKAQDFQKVVVSRRETFSANTSEPMKFFTALVDAYPTAFVSCFFHPKIGMWMSATPEKLVRIHDGRFQTMALAGTQKFEGNTNVRWGEKEIAEQKFVTDFIRHELDPYVSDFEASEAYTQRAANLLHLRTDISGILKPDAQLVEIINTLHPTPAVCGYPKDPARRFILENEGYDREFYSGFLGELNAGDSCDLYVNLRCMKVARDSISVYVGCGITRDSDPPAEFEETVNKSLVIKSIIQ